MIRRVKWFVKYLTTSTAAAATFIVLAFALTSAGTAVATEMVDSGDIRNQTIKSWDISRGGVASSEVRNQSLHSWDIARGGVGTSEVRNQSLRSWDIAAEGVGTSEIRDGNVFKNDLSEEVRSQLGKGPKGDPGNDGADGQDGTDGVSGYEVVGRNADAKDVSAGETVEIKTACRSENQPETAPQKLALSGGAAGSGVVINQSFPSDIEQVSGPTENDPAGLWAAKSWTVVVTSNSDTKTTVQPYVVCAIVN